MKFVLLGGDDRSVRLYRLLRSDGHEVYPFALEKALPGGGAPGDIPSSGFEADCILLPLPCEKGGVLNAPFSEKIWRPEALLARAAPGTLVCAGMPGEATRSACRKNGLPLADYGRREDFALRNADLTAEGALALLLDGPRSLRGSRVLIAGFGRIGRALAGKLIPLGAAVTVSARSPGARAEAELRGCAAVDLGSAPLRAYDAVVNTIPETVFGGEALEGFGPARLIELASPPYGFDPGAAEALGKHILRASGLPGKTAPESAAEAVRKTIYEIWKERS